MTAIGLRPAVGIRFRFLPPPVAPIPLLAFIDYLTGARDYMQLCCLGPQMSYEVRAESPAAVIRAAYHLRTGGVHLPATIPPVSLAEYRRFRDRIQHEMAVLEVRYESPPDLLMSLTSSAVVLAGGAAIVSGRARKIFDDWQVMRRVHAQTTRDVTRAQLEAAAVAVLERDLRESGVRMTPAAERARRRQVKSAARVLSELGELG